MVVKVIFRGFNFSQDGPGNRLVYHLQGCNMHCPWCSTPESMPETASLTVIGIPADTSCPFGAISNGTLDREHCKACTDKPCVRQVESNIKLSCVEIEIDDIVEEIKSSLPMFFDGGGVTFTGGEPTVQFEALEELLAKVKALGINTAVETNGSHQDLPDLFEIIDCLIIDCKHYDNVIHKKATGVSNETILKNIAEASKKRSQLLVRIPLINGFNSSVKDAECFAKLFESLNPEVCSFELLRYHEYGKDKWQQCGMTYKMKNAKVSDEEFAQFNKVFESHHLKTVRT